jgi:hypothetical protein
VIGARGHDQIPAATKGRSRDQASVAFEFPQHLTADIPDSRDPVRRGCHNASAAAIELGIEHGGAMRAQGAHHGSVKQSYPREAVRFAGEK